MVQAMVTKDKGQIVKFIVVLYLPDQGRVKFHIITRKISMPSSL